MDRRHRPIVALLALALAIFGAFLLLRDRNEVEVAPAPVPSPAPAVPSAEPAPAAVAKPVKPANESAASVDASPEPAGEARGPGVVVVTVLALPGDTPLEGAKVDLTVDTPTGFTLESYSTSADGIVRFDALKADEGNIRVTAPGRVPERRSVSGIRDPGERTLTVSLADGVALDGIVLAGRERRPVPGAKVNVDMGGSIGTMSSVTTDPYLTNTVTDDQGRFRLDGIPRKQIVTISSSAPGFVDARRCLLLDEGAESHPSVVLVLEEGWSVAGLVTDPEGKPVAGAKVMPYGTEVEGKEVSLEQLECLLGNWGWAGAMGERISGSDGRFEFDGLRVGRAVRLYASATGFARSRASDPPVVGSDPGVRHTVDLRLRPAAILRVRVVDDKGRELPGASAQIEERPGDYLSPEREDSGTDRFDRLLAGEWTVEVVTPGFEVAKEKVPLVEGESKEVRVILTPAAPATPSSPGAPTTAPKSGSVRLRLVVPSGSVLPSQVRVAVQNEDGGGSAWSVAVKDGVVVVENVSPSPVRIVVFVEGLAPGEREVDLEPGEDRNLGDLILDHGADLAGLVQDFAGKPLAGARVMVDLPGFENAVGTTGPDGRYRVSRIPPGERWIRVQAEGLLDGDETLLLDAGTTNRNYTLVPPVPVRGVVKAAEGKLAEGIHATFLFLDEAPPGIPRQQTVYVDGDGAFAFEAAAGNYAVEVLNKEERVLLRQSASFDGKAPGKIELTLP